MKVNAAERVCICTEFKSKGVTHAETQNTCSKGSYGINLFTLRASGPGVSHNQN